jgi:hypothetical protein
MMLNEVELVEQSIPDAVDSCFGKTFDLVTTNNRQAARVSDRAGLNKPGPNLLPSELKYDK